MPTTNYIVHVVSRRVSSTPGIWHESAYGLLGALPRGPLVGESQCNAEWTSHADLCQPCHKRRSEWAQYFLTLGRCLWPPSCKMQWQTFWRCCIGRGENDWATRSIPGTKEADIGWESWSTIFPWMLPPQRHNFIQAVIYRYTLKTENHVQILLELLDYWNNSVWL